MKIEKAERETSVDSIVKSFSCRRYGKGECVDLILNHAGDTKYHAILNDRMNLIHHI